MGEWSANNQARATALWDRLLGLFGDSLLRKFGPAPPEEWLAAVGKLSDIQIERGIRRFVFGGWKGGAPSLPEFVHMCRVIGEDAPDDGTPRVLSLPAVEGQKFDGWDISGNMRFWKYITHRLTETPRAWGPPKSTQQAEATRIAVGYKNAWAQDMREASGVDPNTGEILMPPEDEQVRTFIECMGRAEADIMLYLQGKAA